jgi:riboflavin synthase
MFTGLIEELGTLVDRIEEGSSLRLQFEAGNVLSDLKIDDSIAVNGCCQTVIGVQPSSFQVIAVSETLKKTTLGSLTIGERVNLERAATLATRLGGHLVQGHVDCRGRLAEVRDLNGSWEYFFQIPSRFARYVVPVGSIAIEGVSLTVASITDTLEGYPDYGNPDSSLVKVAIIPHTHEVTTFHRLQPGQEVNLEFDVISKMVERLIAKPQA